MRSTQRWFGLCFVSMTLSGALGCFEPRNPETTPWRCTTASECSPGVSCLPTGYCASCGSEAFLCSDGSCLPPDLECDGRPQCSDGSDELGCGGEGGGGSGGVAGAGGTGGDVGDGAAGAGGSAGDAGVGGMGGMMGSGGEGGAPSTRCGDGNHDADEECDDGNLWPFDACDDACTRTEYVECGDLDCDASGTLAEGSKPVGAQLSLPADQSIPWSGFGNTMAFDGQTLYVAARNANPGVYRYTYRGGQEQAQPANPPTRAHQAPGDVGTNIPRLALAVSGRFSLVGNPTTGHTRAYYGYDAQTGQVEVTFDGASPANSERGYSLDLSPRGTGESSVVAAIGSPGQQVVEVTSIEWGARLGQRWRFRVDTPEPSTARFGRAVALSRSNQRVSLFVSANGRGTGVTGKVYVFDVEQPSGEQSVPEILTAPEPPTAPEAPENSPSMNGFGFSIAARGDHLAVGAPGGAAAAARSGSGRVYIFRRDDSGFVFQEELEVPSSGVRSGEFGYAVSLDGPDAKGRMSLVVGAPGDANVISDNHGGRAYVFTQVGVRDETRFTHSHTLSAVNPNEGDRFGHSVAHVGATVFVGAPNRDIVRVRGGEVSGAGSVYQFRLDAPLCEATGQSDADETVRCVCLDEDRVGPRCMPAQN